MRHLFKTAHVVVCQVTLGPGEVVRPPKAPVDAFVYVLEGSPAVEIRTRDLGVLFLVVKTPDPKA